MDACGTEGSLGRATCLFFRRTIFDMVLKRARALVARFRRGAPREPNTRTEESSLRDPDGYYVTISALTRSS